jgi:hypothetical protein
LKAVKGCGSKFLRCKRVLLVEVSNLVFSISKICCRFLKVGAFFIAFPFDSILELLMKDMRVCDLVDFIFLFTFYHNRVRWWRFVKAIVSIRSKMVNMKNRMELQIVR